MFEKILSFFHRHTFNIFRNDCPVTIIDIIYGSAFGCTISMYMVLKVWEAFS